MANRNFSLSVVSSIFCLLNILANHSVASDDVTEFQTKMIEGTLAKGPPSIPKTGLTVNSKTYTTPEDSVGREGKTVFDGNMSEGMTIGIYGESETRWIFNRSYAFEVTRERSSSPWLLDRVYDREDGVSNVETTTYMQLGNRIGLLNWGQIITDSSFKVLSINSNAEEGPTVQFEFDCRVSDRPDFVIHGGTATVNPELGWRLENYSVEATYAGDEKATLRGRNTYDEDERITNSSYANFIDGSDARFARAEIDFIFKVSQDVFQDTGELYYLSDYGFPEPPLGGSTLFSPWEIGTAVALLMFGIFGFWYARR